VRNAGGATTPQNVGVRLTLPDALWSPSVGRPVATTVKQQHGAMYSKARVAATYEAPNVYWLPISVPAGKKGVVTVRVKAKLAACPLTDTSLAFGGLVYQTDATTGNVTCATAATLAGTARTAIQVKARSTTKTLPPSACPTPAPPGTPFVAIAQNQRCLEAQLTPMQGQRRRRRVLADKEDEATATAAYTVDDCRQACSFTLRYTTPFFMNFYQPASGPAECYCCQTCTLVFAPGVQALRVDVAATHVRVEAKRGGGRYRTCVPLFGYSTR
jgi:hypothetical protein